MSRLRDTILLALMLVALAALARYVAGCQTLTPADKQAIAIDAVRIAVCQSNGRECRRTDAGSCWEVYDACIVDAGLRGDP